MSQARDEASDRALKELWMYLSSRKDKLAKSVAKNVEPDRMLRIAYTAATKTPKLLMCPHETLFMALVKAGQMGLEPNTAFDHGYLIPRYNSMTKQMEANFEPSYKGLIHVAYKTGAVKAIWAEVVYERDVFRPVRGHSPDIIHEPYFGAERRGDMIGAYAVALLPDGTRKDSLLHREDIDRIKAFVSAQNREGELKGPWVSNEGEMAKKSAIRNLFKTLGVGPLEEAASETVDEILNPDEMPREVPALTSSSRGERAVLERMKPKALPEPSAISALPSSVIETVEVPVTNQEGTDP
jgi:recombination protein RecT